MGTASVRDIIDRGLRDPPESVRSGSNQQWTIVFSDDVHVDPCGGHSLKKIVRGLDMKSAVLRRPMGETIEIELLAYGDRAILVPA